MTQPGCCFRGDSIQTLSSYAGDVDESPRTPSGVKELFKIRAREVQLIQFISDVIRHSGEHLRLLESQSRLSVKCRSNAGVEKCPRPNVCHFGDCI